MRTTKKEVIKAIQDHIKGFFEEAGDDWKSALYDQMNALKDNRDIYGVAAYTLGLRLVEYGFCLIYTEDKKHAIEEWGASDGKEHASDDIEKFYNHLIARKAAKIYEKQEAKNA